MKKRIIVSLLALLLIFAVGAVISLYLITHTGDEISDLLNQYEVEQVRRSLVTNFQTVQSSIYAINAVSAEEMEDVQINMMNLHETAERCTICHHPKKLENKIITIQRAIKDYEDNISLLFANNLDLEKFIDLKTKTINFGKQLMLMITNMSHTASENLNRETNRSLLNISEVKSTLLLTIVVAFLLSVYIAIKLTRSLTKPVSELVRATRLISSGQFGVTINYKDSTELGELAEYFNNMSFDIKRGYEKIQREMVQRKKTESALVKSEKFLSTIFESIHDPFCIFDRNYKIIKANGAYAELRRQSLSRLYGARCYEALYGMDSKCNNCIVDTTFRSKDPCAKDKLVILEDGSRIWLDIYTYPIYDEQGNVTHVIEYIRDISERKQTELALRESKERYELAALGANDGLWDWNMKSNVIYFSHRWKFMVGFSNKDIKENPSEWFDRIHPDDCEKVERDLENHINGYTSHFESEHRILHKDGMYRWVLVRGLAVRDNSGRAHRIAGSMTDITNRKDSEQQLIFDALHDALTGLPNRLLFMDRLQHAIEREKRNQNHLFAVLFLDIDRFKILNDSMGHAIGDEMLKAVSKRLEECLRLGDTVARFGGDEFAILLEDLKNEQEAFQISDRIQDKLSSPFNLNGQELYSSASIGIVFSATGYDQPEHLLRNADIAMYHAKTKSGTNYEVFDNQMYADVVARLELETDIRLAVKRNEFVLHYQPIVSVSTGKIIGLESLIRWNHPVHGLIYPEQFISVAEDTGLIIEMGDWVLDESCRQLHEWHLKIPLMSHLTISINISSKQLFPTIVDKIKQILIKTGLNPHNLILEITESMIIENAEVVFSLLLQLKDMNVNLYIDDFGIGYSSLSSLHDLPVDVLKIDRSFVQRISHNEGDIEIVKAITNLARSLDMGVIAEGVEGVHQLQKLKSLGCEYVQGYLFSKPLDRNEIELLLKRGRVDQGTEMKKSVSI